MGFRRRSYLPGDWVVPIDRETAAIVIARLDPRTAIVAEPSPLARPRLELVAYPDADLRVATSVEVAWARGDLP